MASTIPRYQKKTAPDGRQFWLDHKTKQTSWSLPKGAKLSETVVLNAAPVVTVPPGVSPRTAAAVAKAVQSASVLRWERKTDAAGREYWLDHKHHDSHWTLPSGVDLNERVVPTTITTSTSSSASSASRSSRLSGSATAVSVTSVAAATTSSSGSARMLSPVEQQQQQQSPHRPRSRSSNASVASSSLSSSSLSSASSATASASPRGSGSHLPVTSTSGDATKYATAPELPSIRHSGSAAAAAASSSSSSGSGEPSVVRTSSGDIAKHKDKHKAKGLLFRFSKRSSTSEVAAHTVVEPSAASDELVSLPPDFDLASAYGGGAAPVLPSDPDSGLISSSNTIPLPSPSEDAEAEPPTPPGSAASSAASVAASVASAAATASASSSSPASASPSADAPPSFFTKRVLINRKELTPAEVEYFESMLNAPILDGNYWYDVYSGAWGAIGGPTLTYTRPGLSFAHALPSDASESSTGVFINNRELHPVDIVAIQSTTGLLVPCVPSRWWQDAYGNLGLEGNPTPVQNLFYPQMVAATPPTQPSMLPVDQLHAPPYAVASVVVPSSQ